jgi:DNA-binding HxlR family transcriptional regulator
MRSAARYENGHARSKKNAERPFGAGREESANRSARMIRSPIPSETSGRIETCEYSSRECKTGLHRVFLTLDSKLVGRNSFAPSKSGGPPIPQVPPPKRHPYDQWSPDARALDLVGDKWTLLIVRDLSAGPRRFVELQRVLPGISTEQLRSRLNRMVADGMLTRKRYREVPPRVDYELTERARELMPVLGALARWGYEWTWSAPRSSESVDIGAIFRLAPGLVQPPAGTQGTVEFQVNDPNEGGEAASYSLTASGEQVAIEEAPAAQPDARVSGEVASWVAAFSPGHDRAGLSVTVDRRLADALLDGLGAGEARAADAAAAA